MIDSGLNAGVIMNLPAYLQYALFLAVAIAGFFGAFTAATMRDDAYEAANRHSKWMWVGILVASGLVCLTPMPLLPWIGAIAIGLYWFDVRPHLQSILRGDYY